MKYKVIPLLLCPVLAYGKDITHISTYEDNYVLGTYTTDINQSAYSEMGSEMDSLQDFEVKFQISASIPFYRFSSGTALMGLILKSPYGNWQTLISHRHLEKQTTSRKCS
ncbi:phospholipase A [Vibrio parahaemolyticus]|nr:phospholipase A [Vibrio parahaemolyticus]